MNVRQVHALALRDTDVTGAVHRLCDDEGLYDQCLKAFLEDPTIAQLDDAIHAQAWDEAFTAAHALKGLAGNMGFVPLMHAIGQLVILIRGGRTREVGDALLQVSSCYRDIRDGIEQYFSLAD